MARYEAILASLFQTADLNLSLTFLTNVLIVFTKKELFQIIPMHMMTREIIPGRKTEGSTVSSINCDRSSLI